MLPIVLFVCLGVGAGIVVAPPVAKEVKTAAVKTEHAVQHTGHAVKVIATLPVLVVQTARHHKVKPPQDFTEQGELFLRRARQKSCSEQLVWIEGY